MPRLHLTASPATFVAAEQPSSWSDTSYHDVKSAVGDLRFVGVNNGRYQSRQPVLTPAGDVAGYLVQGVRSLGYTWKCVHAGRGFWMTNQTFHATVRGGGSRVSLVEDVGTFFWSSVRKFRVTKVFSFESRWIDTNVVFKRLKGGSQLLFVAACGVCLFDTHEGAVISKIEFREDAQATEGGVALSPDGRILAIATSHPTGRPSIRGRHHENSVRLYELESGERLAEQAVDLDTWEYWTPQFDVRGRLLRVASANHTRVWELSSRDSP